MKAVYPIILTPDNNCYVVDIPDFNSNTQGKDVPDALNMARDAIGLMGITMEDLGQSIPESNSVLPNTTGNELATLVDVDFEAYRKQHENRTIRKNLTLPSWLNEKAEAAGVNFSQILQDALKQKLNIS